MQCPHCQTENREDRENCYACGKDISTLRLLVNKARQHYNDALEHAERGRTEQAIEELQRALDLDSSLVNAHVVLGTLYAQQSRFGEARECWSNALAINPEMARAHDYLERVESVQAALPTLSTYRWLAVVLLLACVGLAASLIYAVRPDPGAAALRVANNLLEQKEYGEARDYLEQARILSPPDSLVNVSAAALERSLNLDVQQRLRIIQDLKYQQLYPEALAEIAQLQGVRLDDSTSGALSAIRSDIAYFYRNMISQLYAAYEQGDIDYTTLVAEIRRFTEAYPASPERTEIQQYLDRAEAIEIQVAMDELERRFKLNNNIDSVIEGLRDLSQRFGESPMFEQERSGFAEAILSQLFNNFTGYLDEDNFVRASELLAQIEDASEQFRELAGLNIADVVELAYDVLKDAQRQYQIKQLETLIDNGQIAAAEEAILDLLQEPDLSPAEMGVLRSNWMRIKRREQVDQIRRSDRQFFRLEISEDKASETLALYRDYAEEVSAKTRIHLLGIAAASAVRLGDDDLATSYAKQLQSLDDEATVTRAVRRMLSSRKEEQPAKQDTRSTTTETTRPVTAGITRSTTTETTRPKPAVRIEPSRPRTSEKPED